MTGMKGNDPVLIKIFFRGYSQWHGAVILKVLECRAIKDIDDSTIILVNTAVKQSSLRKVEIYNPNNIRDYMISG